MFVEIATPCGDLVVHLGNSVFDRHGVFWPPKMSSPRTRESIAPPQQPKVWIPAFAGMTMRARNENPNPADPAVNRHLRGRG